MERKNEKGKGKGGEGRGTNQTRWRRNRIIHSPDITPFNEVLVPCSTTSQRPSMDGIRALMINPFPNFPALNIASLGTKPSIHELLESHQIQTIYSYALGALSYIQGDFPDPGCLPLENS